MNLRAAHPFDAEKIALLHADSWKRTYRGLLRDDFLDKEVITNRLAVWNDRLEKERIDQCVLVAEERQQLLGFICAYGDEDSTWGSLIDNLHVAHAHHRQGIGTLLMRDAGAWLNSHYPQSGAYLWVMEVNQSARRFYEKLGAQNAGTVDKPNPAGGGSAKNCRYRWPRPELLIKAGQLAP